MNKDSKRTTSNFLNLFILFTLETTSYCIRRTYLFNFFSDLSSLYLLTFKNLSISLVQNPFRSLSLTITFQSLISKNHVSILVFIKENSRLSK